MMDRFTQLIDRIGRSLKQIAVGDPDREMTNRERLTQPGALSAVTSPGRSLLAQVDIERARSIVREFGKLSYNSAEWEKMIGAANLRPYGCLIDAFNLNCTGRERNQAVLTAAQALRSAFPAYTHGAAAWRDKCWTTDDLDRILAVVAEALVQSLSKTRTRVAKTASRPCEPVSLLPQESGFVAWRLFRNRHPVSNSPGLYLIGYFEGSPAATVDPLSEQVIYMGIAEGRRTTGMRLKEFQETALCGIGHSAGFTYRVDFAPRFFNSDLELLESFHNTYCSWKDIPSSDPTSPRSIEERLLREYRNMWGQWPLLNRKG